MVKAGYKQTEVGVIPEDWDVDCIDNLARIATGDKNTQDRVEDGLYPFFVRSQIVERISSWTFSGEAVLTAGDGVGTGKVFHYINGKFDTHQRVYRMSDFNERIRGYYFFLYFSANFYNRIMQMTAKSSVDSVRREMISKMPIALPPTVEQEAIAGALSDADGLIESLEALIAKKRAVKQGAMQELLTGKRRLPGFEGEWIDTVLGGVINSIIGGGTPPRSNKNYWGGKIPWATVKDFSSHNPNSTQEYITEEGLANSSSSLIPSGVVVISTRMAIGKPVIFNVDVAINQDLKALFTGKLLDSTYLFFWFNMHERKIALLGSGSTVLGISLGDLKSFPIKVPQTIEEQQTIASVLSDMDAEIEALEARLDKARAVKQGMMHELLTGRIRLIDSE